LDCHQFHFQDEDATGPDLTGYGSREWLVAFLSDPGHARFYGERNDRMPAFGKEGALTTQEMRVVADWLRGDWYRPGSTEEADAGERLVPSAGGSPEGL
jgi:ubiquinol-cytochrome c reductase cytochrome b subunit